MSDRQLQTEQRAVPGARLVDLNLNLVREHVDTAIRRRGYEGPSEPEDYLRHHSCLTIDEQGTPVPTMAGILSFGREPHQFVSVCGIDVAQFSGTRPNSTQMLFSRQIRGDLMSVIDRTIELLWARTEHRTRIVGAERIEEHAYPQVVLRELTVNAVVHRDWSYAGTYIRIQIFPERIEWISPGGFPGRAPDGVTLETLLNAQVSRNPMLAQIFYHAGKVESFGMGIDTVLDALAEAGCRRPEVFDNGDIFMMRVWGKPFGKAIDAIANTSLTARQQRILAEIRARGRCSTVELQQAIGESARTIQRDLRALLEHQLIEASGATSNRIYRPII
jgi:ATP-dependent DNA helicase RecG